MKETLTAVAVLALIFANGATDTPNCIAGAVADGALSYKNACILCAVGNFLGLVSSYAFAPAVSDTLQSLGETESLTALVAVLIFTVFAWILGAPTSESHALIAALGGIALYRGKSVANFIDICTKSTFSCLTGVLLGAVTASIAARRFTATNKRRRIFVATLLSVFHGMQDGQKFAYLLICRLPNSADTETAIILCGAIMGIGCLLGGRRITDTIGRELLFYDSPLCSSASDTSALVCSAGATFLGIPISTTYIKASSLLGAAISQKIPIRKNTAARLFATWCATYPACTAIAYIVCALFDTML